MTTYKVSPIRNGYEVTAPSGKTLDAVWSCEKCWFQPGQRVLIEDDHGNHKIFVKEGSEDEEAGRRNRDP